MSTSLTGPVVFARAQDDALFVPACRVGGLVFTSGQVGLDPSTGKPPGAFEDEVLQVVDNLKRALQEAGSALSAVVNTTCFLSDLTNLEAFNAVYAQRFTTPRPVRSTFQAGLVADFRVEIEAVATLL